MSVHIDIQNVFDYLDPSEKRSVRASMLPWDQANFVFRAKGFSAFKVWQPLVTIQAAMHRYPPAIEPTIKEKEWIAIAALFIDSDQDQAAICKQCFDINGRPIGDSDVTYNPEYLTSNMGPLSDDMHYHVYSSLFYVFWFAVQLTHCKNVELIDQPLTRQQRRMKERKGGIFYKVLAIEPFKRQVRRETAVSGDGDIKRALHICRGHFVTYTEDKPLFGKYAGTFWKPMHIRGQRSAGVVVKDYEVKP